MVCLSIRNTEGLTKKARTNITTFHKYVKCNFNKLIGLLKKDYVYSPFAYLGHYRLTKNICSTTNIVVIDVDHTLMDISDRYKQLLNENLIFIIGTTSDTTNLFKYRVILLLNRQVTAEEYRAVVGGIHKYGLISDLDVASKKPAQAFFAYKDSIVYSSLRGEPLEVESYLYTEERTIPVNDVSPTELIENFNTQFETYKNAVPGNRTRYLLSAGFTMIENGFSDTQLEWGLKLINSWFLMPKDDNSLKRRVINFLKDRRKNDIKRGSH
jgi:hypothetical protein